MDSSQSLTIRELQESLAGWEQGSKECVPRLAHALGFDDPDQVMERPYTAAAPLHDLLTVEDLASLPDDDFEWLRSHVIGYTAYYLTSSYGGSWVVDADENSPTYATYVLGDFPDPTPKNFKLDVGRRVAEFFDLPVGRSYTNLIGDLVESIPGIPHYDFSS
ncbi:hypothetical protein ABZ896_41385 [Streptomyces sp. NPDC047072]|uniref:hypothetical protein n=1 Tax=Streptomyces sp. NPDC047072 TaxID=3154809 RepID=UPI0033F9FB11